MSYVAYVLHIKPFFLPVDIQHPAQPVSVPILQRGMFKLCGHQITPQRYEHVLTNAVGTVAVDNAMPCHPTAVVLDIATAYTFYEKRKRKKT